jgi:hypothetical protein
MGQTKYYTISEVAELLDMSQPSLRYLEKTISRFKVRKIRGRRYYTGENIAILREKISNQYSLFSNAKPVTTAPALVAKSKEVATKPTSFSNILEKITNLEKKFLSLKNRLQ